MKTKTQARTAPAAALRRVAVVAAVLLTLCLVFMMPVGAEEIPDAKVMELTKDEFFATIKDADMISAEDFETGKVFVLQFSVPDIEENSAEEEEHMATWGNWYVDFVLKTNVPLVLGDDEDAEGERANPQGYLIGNYGSFGWLKVPSVNFPYGSIENIPFPGNSYEPIVSTLLPLNYGFIYDGVGTFLCAMYVSEEFLNENENFVATLELRMADPSIFGGDTFNGADDTHRKLFADQSIRVGKSYRFSQDWSITYEGWPEGVENPNPVSYNASTEEFELVVPDRGEDYYFVGWYNTTTTDVDADNADGPHASITISGLTNIGNLKYTPVWIDRHTVTFDNGEETSSYKINDGERVTLPENPTKEGHTFAGWYLGKILYDFATPVTKDITLTAEWKENGEPVEVAPSVSATITVSDEQISITPVESTTTNVKLSEDKETVTITDASTGVKMEIQFEGSATENGNTILGKVDSVSVTYPEAPAESEKEINQQVVFTMETAMTELPKIDSKIKQEVSEAVKQEQKANVLAMITATHTDLPSINNNIKEVTVTFKIPVTAVDSDSILYVLHVDTEGQLKENGKYPVTLGEPIDGYYVITISGSGFSSYVLVEEEPAEEEIINDNTGGSATDTGSGNYQYYPRSVPTDGIVDFGTSKVVTGMELPAGSDGTVTLNIKPTFTMPENGFYAFEIDAPGYNLDAKINGGLSFQIPVADLEAAGWTAEDIVLFHGTVGEDGKIVWEALPTNLVKNENGVAYYKAAINGCSPFYIGFVKDGSVVNTEAVGPTVPETPEQPVTPDEPEILPPVEEPTEEPETPASPAPILAVLAGLGAVVALRRK